MQRHRSATVSVGLPVYNGEKYLEQAIESIRAQTHDDLELIISDNASTDRTQEICRAYVEMDPRVHYHRNDVNIGLYRNFNRAFELSHGAYFKWAATDDLCKPLLIQRCFEALEQNPDSVLSSCHTEFVDEQGKRIELEHPNWHVQHESVVDRVKLSIDTEQIVTVLDGLVRSSSFREAGLFPDHYGADRVLICRLAMFGKFYEVPETLFIKRFHTNTSAQFSSDEEWFPNGGPFTTWRIYSGYLKLIAASNFSTSDKLELLKFTGQRIYWKKSHIRRELMHYLRHFAQ